MPSFSEPTLHLTRDGSHTLLNAEFDETYHSRNGAWEESLYVFVRQGLEYRLRQKLQACLCIFEMGFGTGLNALLSLQYAHEHNQKIAYYSIESRPLSLALIHQLNYTERLTDTDRTYFIQLHEVAWNQTVTISPFVSLHKIQLPFQQLQTLPAADLVFYDAFAPDKQPELWSKPVFEKLFQAMNPGAVWVTYSAKGQIRRDLKDVGFNVERLPGPPMKRHMLRAEKPA